MESQPRYRVTYQQREAMLRFMQEHPSLATGRFDGPDALRTRTDLIKRLAIELNSYANGATKTPDKWLRSWQDWRSDTKKKAATIRRKAAGTGGGPPTPPLTPLEEELICFIGTAVVYGVEGTVDPLELANVVILQEEESPPAPQATVHAPVLAAQTAPSSVLAAAGDTAACGARSAAVGTAPSQPKRARIKGDRESRDERMVVAFENQLKSFNKLIEVICPLAIAMTEYFKSKLAPTTATTITTATASSTATATPTVATAINTSTATTVTTATATFTSATTTTDAVDVSDDEDEMVEVYQYIDFD